MQRKQGGLVPIGDAVSGLDDVLVSGLRNDSPQARHHFTQADQVDQLVSASEADPDLGFMARTMALCSLPRSNPGKRTQYVRRNGPYTLVMSATGLNKLPFGNLPRLLMARVEEDQNSLAGSELLNGVRRLNPASLDPGHRSIVRSAAPQGLAVPGSRIAPGGPGGPDRAGTPTLNFSKRSES